MDKFYIMMLAYPFLYINVIITKVMKFNKRNVYIILIVIWIAFIWGNSLNPGSDSSAQSHFVMELLNNITGLLGFYLSEFVVRKMAHMFEYFVLALLTINLIETIKQSSKTKYYVYVLLFSMLIASIDETIQLFVPGRAGAFTDVLIDSSGALIALLLFMVYKKFRNKLSLR